MITGTITIRNVEPKMPLKPHATSMADSQRRHYHVNFINFSVEVVDDGKKQRRVKNTGESIVLTYDEDATVSLPFVNCIAIDAMDIKSTTHPYLNPVVNFHNPMNPRGMDFKISVIRPMPLGTDVCEHRATGASFYLVEDYEYKKAY